MIKMSLCDYRLDEFGRKKQLHGECPECGSKDIKVYLLADYNSTVNAINMEGCVEWYYSDALPDMYCQDCDAEFRDAKEVKDED
jgi:hypothetical protein